MEEEEDQGIRKWELLAVPLKKILSVGEEVILCSGALCGREMSKKCSGINGVKPQIGADSS